MTGLTLMLAAAALAGPPAAAPPVDAHAPPMESASPARPAPVAAAGATDPQAGQAMSPMMKMTTQEVMMPAPAMAGKRKRTAAPPGN